jgi:hypothetical protein
MEISKDFLVFVMSATLSLGAILFYIMLYIKKKSEMQLRERYDFEKQMVELEYMRKNMEMQLYDVSKKLEENESRWKDMNHLVISTQNKFEESKHKHGEIQSSDFLKNFGITNQKDFEVDNKMVFVLTPFNDNYRSTFIQIRKVCENMNLKCIRGDEEFIPNEIFPSIIKQILRSRFLIANISGRNPNVMYELGIAHALGKPVIIVAQDFTDIPFDLNNKRIVIYRNEKELQDKLNTSINDMLINRDI